MNKQNILIALIAMARRAQDMNTCRLIAEHILIAA